MEHMAFDYVSDTKMWAEQVLKTFDELAAGMLNR